jgi:SAM-dependent methyltransferase
MNQPGAYVPQNYWEEIARTYAEKDPIAAVCYADAPPWLNRFFVKFQAKAIEEAVARCIDADSPISGWVLDIGCGTGRWSGWLSRRYENVIGIDLSETMMRQARKLHPQVSFLNACAEGLPLRAEVVALAFSVTVIQHIPRQLQQAAIAEIARVLKPGGMVVCLELTDRHALGSHVYPNSLDRWIRMFQEHGLQVILAKGQGYALLLRAMARLAALLPDWLLRRRGATGQVALTERVKSEARERRSPLTSASVSSLKGPLALAARILVWISYPLEYLLSRFLGPQLAQQALFVLIKEKGGQPKGEVRAGTGQT